MGKICKRLHSISCENNITAIDGKPQSPCNTKFHRLDSIPPSSIGQQLGKVENSGHSRLDHGPYSIGPLLVSGPLMTKDGNLKLSEKLSKLKEENTAPYQLVIWIFLVSHRSSGTFHKDYIFQKLQNFEKLLSVYRYMSCLSNRAATRIFWERNSFRKGSTFDQNTE